MWNTSGWEPIPAERWATTCRAGTGAASFFKGGRQRLTEDERLGHSTSKIPPYWEPTLELKGYPFRVWLQDLDVWAAGTELQQEQQAPAVVQRLGGAARELTASERAEVVAHVDAAASSSTSSSTARPRRRRRSR